MVYLIDFGLAKFYVDKKTRAHVPYAEGKVCAQNTFLRYRIISMGAVAVIFYSKIVIKNVINNVQYILLLC